MSFFGQAFMFDSTPCEMFDLMMYDVGDQDEDIQVGGGMEIEDEVIGDHWRPYFYGVKTGDKLEFDIVFGVNERRIRLGKFLDRWELEHVASWLTGHTAYKMLFIDQPDARTFGYRCMITDLKVTQYGAVPWALKAHVTCDSSYAYLEPVTYSFQVNGSKEVEVYNESSLNQLYHPVITITKTGGSAFSIKNAQDNNRGPELTDIPASVTTITMDCEHCILRSDQDLNLYSGFNFEFLGLAKGLNVLTLTGTGRMAITCEYPVNIGG